jgi:subtilase family serine protease
MRRIAKNIPALLAALFVLFAGVSAQAQKPVSAAPPGQLVQFSVYLPLQNSSQLDQLISGLHTKGSPNYQQWLTPQQFRQRFGASPSALAQVQSEMAEYGITTLGSNSHSVQLQGTVADIENCLGVTLMNATYPNGSQGLVSTTPVKLPTALSQVGGQVVSFAALVPHHTHSTMVSSSPIPANEFSPLGPYLTPDFKQAYDFPSGAVLTGAGRRIGIIGSGDFLPSDMGLYFSVIGLPVPAIEDIEVDGGAPFSFPGSAETELDLEQAGGIAPGATLVFYNLPVLSNQELINTYTNIVETNAVDIVSSSFGSPEGIFTPAYNGGQDFTFILRIYSDIFRHGNAQGITFFASSGDNAGLDLPSLSYFTTPPQNPPIVAGNFLPGIEHPASDPNVTAVGGTNLVTTFNPPSTAAKYVSENAFPDPLIDYDPFGIGNLLSGGLWGSGSGPSVVFRKPLYQLFANTGSNMRTIPDISLQMGGCPAIAVQPCGPNRSATIVALDGGFFGFVGTSIASPGMAAALALAEQNLGGHRLGNVNYEIYLELAAQMLFFHTNIPGNNGIKSTTMFGYDPVLGARTPFLKNVILAPFVPPAGNPGTASNP